MKYKSECKYISRFMYALTYLGTQTLTSASQQTLTRYSLSSLLHQFATHIQQAGDAPGTQKCLNIYECTCTYILYKHMQARMYVSLFIYTFVCTSHMTHPFPQQSGFICNKCVKYQLPSLKLRCAKFPKINILYFLHRTALEFFFWYF